MFPRNPKPPNLWPPCGSANDFKTGWLKNMTTLSLSFSQLVAQRASISSVGNHCVHNPSCRGVWQDPSGPERSSLLVSARMTDVWNSSSWPIQWFLPPAVVYHVWYVDTVVQEWKASSGWTSSARKPHLGMVEQALLVLFFLPVQACPAE